MPLAENITHQSYKPTAMLISIRQTHIPQQQRPYIINNCFRPTDQPNPHIHLEEIYQQDMKQREPDYDEDQYYYQENTANLKKKNEENFTTIASTENSIAPKLPFICIPEFQSNILIDSGTSSSVINPEIAFQLFREYILILISNSLPVINSSKALLVHEFPLLLGNLESDFLFLFHKKYGWSSLVQRSFRLGCQIKLFIYTVTLFEYSEIINEHTHTFIDNFEVLVTP